MHTHTQSNTAKLYCEKITKMVHFCWRAVDSGRMGTVTLDGLRLPLSSISIVRPVPLLFGKPESQFELAGPGELF